MTLDADDRRLLSELARVANKSGNTLVLALIAHLDSELLLEAVLGDRPKLHAVPAPEDPP